MPEFDFFHVLSRLLHFEMRAAADMGGIVEDAPREKHPMLNSRFALGFVAACLYPLAACSPSETKPDAGSSGDAGSRADGGASSSDATANVVGTFNVKLQLPVTAGEAAHTSIAGKISDGPEPSALIWNTAATSGDCALLKPKVPFCSTSCGASAVCTDDEKCQEYPTSQSVGTVTVSGIHTASNQTSFDLTEGVKGNYTYIGSLAYPGFEEGDTLRFSASGGFYPAFTLETQGIKPLELTSTSLTLANNQPLSLTWTAGQSGRSTIHVKLDISHHGGTKGMISCDTADSGSLQLPATLVSQLLSLGVAGFPTIVVTRTAEASAAVPKGLVKLLVTSQVEQAVHVPGVDSCNKDEDCPSGKTCKNDLTCS
jgi:hypothetical protein